MKFVYAVLLIALALAVAQPCLATDYYVAASFAAPTFVKLNEGLGLPSDGWGMPRINNSQQIIMTKRTSSSYGGYPWFYNGSTWAAVPNTASVNNNDGINWRMNDNGRFVYIAEASGKYYVHVADATGDIIVNSIKNQYACAINDTNVIAMTQYELDYDFHARISTDMLVTSTAFPQNGVHTKTVDINNAGQVAFKGSGGYGYGNGPVYCYTPDGSGTPGSGSITTFKTAADYSPVDIDADGGVFYGCTDGWLYRNNTQIYQMPNAIYNGGLAISDNGKMVWTQYVNSRFDVWTFINDVPTNITAGLFGGTADALYPDINDNGDIVFMVTTGSFTSDIYLWSVPKPTYGISNRAACDQIISTASAKFNFKVWGKVTNLVSGNSFTIDDGFGTPVIIVAPGFSGIQLGDYVSASGKISGESMARVLNALAVDVRKLN